MGLEMKFSNINEAKYYQEVKFLKDQIINGTHTDYFLALDNEAGFGKTIYTESALIEAANNNKRSILCRLFIEDCKDSADRINEEAKKVIAIALDNSNFKRYKEVLNNYPIIIITHEKYIGLCKDLKQQQEYSQGRDILIIDEEIDMVDPIVFNLKTYGEFIGRIYKFPSILSLYEKVTKELTNFIESNKRKTFFKPKNNMKNQIRELKALIDANIDNEYASIFDLKKSYFSNEVERLEILLNNLSVADNKVLFNFNRNIKFWRLKNNISLDACANLNYIYILSKEFKVLPQERVFDHSNWWLHVIEHNSCKTKKEKSINFYEEVNKDINRIMENVQGLVIIGGKDEQSKFSLSGKVQFAWFNYTTGKNHWRDLDSCYITLNPQIPFPMYILKYMFYSGKTFEEAESWGAGKFGEVYRFRNKELELIRQTSIATEIYQAIKRINRDNSGNANVYIINNDNEIMDKITRMLQNVKLDRYSLNIKYKDSDKKSEDGKETKLNKYSKELIKLISNMEKDTKYSKEFVREEIDFKNKKTFSSKLLKRQEIIDCLASENIYTGYNYFIKC